MEKLTFKQLTRNLLKKRFGLALVDKHEIWNNWYELSKSQNITTVEEQCLMLLQKALKMRSSSWNEYELSEWFIGPVLAFVEFNSDYITLFANRDICAVVQDCELSGRPDVLISSGIDSPETPYFCFHEYKQQTDPNGNPQTQLLGAMLTAQELNNNEKPVYGVYIVGYDWTFVTLQGNEWCESKAYHATDEEIFDIFKILKALKEIILSY
jgi:hypothetical protein